MTLELEPSGPGRHLTVCATGGLANRLKVLISGLVVAEATGRTFRMLWPINNRCAAPFGSLFANRWNVVDVSRRDSKRLPKPPDWRYDRLPDLVDDPSRHIFALHSNWLIRPAIYPAHEPLRDRCVQLFGELDPVPAIRAQVEAFRAAHFRPFMIGVHLRRGDLLRVRPDVTVTTEQAMVEVGQLLRQTPDAGVLLCTDDGAVDPQTREVRHEGVRETFRREFGARVIWTEPRSLDRNASEAIQDALVDLLLLRETQTFVGSKGSTFSELVRYGRTTPAILCEGPTASYRRFERLSKATGLYYLLMFVGRRRYGRHIPFLVVWRLMVASWLPERYRPLLMPVSRTDGPVARPVSTAPQPKPEAPPG